MQFHYDKVVNVNAKRMECDEIWSLRAMKEKTADRLGIEEGAGDA